jgi:RNA polymerase primary sigma factor
MDMEATQLKSDTNMGIYLRDISKTELLTPAEEVKLVAKIKRGDGKARAHMIKANLRLVVKIAKNYSTFGLPLADLVSEGNIGLMKAVERFDPTKGAKLSTYASWWIKQSIKRALADQCMTIRLPVHMIDKIASMRRITSHITDAIGREPTDDELAEELGIPRRKLAFLKSASRRPISLDAPVNDGERDYRGTVGDERAVDPLAALTDKNLYGQLDDLLGVLDGREHRTIDARFGLSGKSPMTLDEVGSELGVTRERIRQIQNVAVDKMRRALAKKEKPMPKSVAV